MARTLLLPSKFREMRLISTKQRDATSAFTIVEVLIAMAVAGVALMALYGSISFGFSMVKATRENLQATQILMDRAETIRLASWPEINDPALLPRTFETNWDSLGVLYSGVMTVSAPAQTWSYASDMRLVNITVNWTNGARPQSRTLQTYVSRYGLHRYLIK